MCLGFLNSSWYSLLYYQLLFCSLYSARLNKEINKWSVSLLVIIICIAVKINLNIPQILEGSNVFIGGEKYDKSIFKNELPEKIFTKMQKDFIEVFPNSISGPDIKTYHKSVNQIIKKTDETRLVESINWNNRHGLQLGAFNNTRYNTYGKQEPNRNNLPYFVKYTFPVEYNKSKAKFC